MSGGDAQTLDFYTREAAAYAEHVKDEAKRAPQLAQFAALLPQGGDVLDFGCGPAWAANAFLQLGLNVRGFDGSQGLADEARARYGIEVAVGRFEDFADVAAYDGIWASFCLLHDSRVAMPAHLGRLYRALRPGGVLYVGLKEGEGRERDDIGRLYTYFTEPEMRGLLTDAGFEVSEVQTEPSVGFSGVPCDVLHIFARRD